MAHPQVVAQDTFYLLEAWYDADAETINLRVSTEAVRGAIASTAWNGGVHFGDAALKVAAHDSGSDAHLDGVIDALGLWGHVHTETESLALWNAGNGLELNGRIGAVIVAHDEFNPPDIGNPYGVGFDHLTGSVWAYGLSDSTLDEHSATGTLLGSVPRPGEPAGDVDLEFAPEALSLSGVPIPEGALLFINGETDGAEIYAVDETSGAVLATLAAGFGASHVVGGAYHPLRDTFFLIQDNQPGTAELKNLVGEVDPVSGTLLNSFQVSPEFGVFLGDLDVCATTGNLLVVGSLETTIAEFTPDGTFVAEYDLPATVTQLSGIAIDELTGDAWVSEAGGFVTRLTGVPCPQPLPEPGSALMLATGCAALLGLDRRRRSRARKR